LSEKETKTSNSENLREEFQGKCEKMKTKRREWGRGGDTQSWVGWESEEEQRGDRRYEKKWV